MQQPAVRTSAAALLAGLTACGAGLAEPPPDSGDPFQFRATHSIPVEITIRKHGAPLQGAAVSVVAVYRADLTGEDSAALAQGAVYFDGGSDPEGAVRAQITIPANVTDVDVVVDHPGSSGPYSREDLRTAWGDFGPSSRVTVGVGALASMSIDLGDRP